MTTGNRAAAALVADAIEGRTIPGLAFDMCQWGSDAKRFDEGEWADEKIPRHECQTVGCAAGWTVAVLDGPEAYRNMVDDDYLGHVVPARAQELLGLSEREAKVLFHAYDATDKQVADHLRIIANGGQVDWTQVDYEGLAPEGYAA